MSSIEQRLVRDIAAVTGGVVVSDSDLREARLAVAERTDSKRAGVRLGRLAPAAAAAVVLVLIGVTAALTLGDDDKAIGPAGPAPGLSDPLAEFLSGDSPTPQRLKGLWRVDNGVILLRFDDDGTVHFDNQGQPFSRPGTTGSYVISGDVITVTLTKAAQQSCLGTEIAMRAALPEAGVLRYVPSASSTRPCSPLPVGRGELDQVLPTSQEMAHIAVSTDPAWKPLVDKTRLYGVWQAEGGGYALELDPDGAYFVADASAVPIDQGTWAFRGAALTLTSAAGSATCSPGDALVLGALELEVVDNVALRGTVAKNTCRGAWTPAAWFRLPNANG